jgi:starvation-inducible DNA-binding protein
MMRGPFGLTVSNRDKQAALLQACLVEMIDFTLMLKQAHWNLVGPGFIAAHEQLDDVIESVRTISDELAERIASLGLSPDGRAATVTKSSKLPGFSDAFVSVEEAMLALSTALETAIRNFREGIETMGDLDPISEDLLVASTRTLEKHHWMLRSHLPPAGGKPRARGKASDASS